MSNLVLLAIDIFFLPVTLIRLICIYFLGSKYNIKGFSFLDVIMHADRPYFNQDNNNCINVLKDDYRVVIRDDSRLFKDNNPSCNTNKLSCNTNKSSCINANIISDLSCKDSNVSDIEYNGNNGDNENSQYSEDNNSNLIDDIFDTQNSVDKNNTDTDNSSGSDSENDSLSFEDNRKRRNIKTSNKKNVKNNIFAQNTSKKEFDEVLHRLSDKVTGHTDIDDKDDNDSAYKELMSAFDS